LARTLSKCRVLYATGVTRASLDDKLEKHRLFLR
jgi:hypothetical protein